MYLAAVLDEASRQRLLDEVIGNVPTGHDIVCHHVTLHMGDRRSDDPNIGDSVLFSVDGVGIITDRVVAVRVRIETQGIKSDNLVPHVTVAVNRSVGAKPFESNQITVWNDIESFPLTGVVRVCL